jgi:hypothetical protein
MKVVRAVSLDIEQAQYLKNHHVNLSELVRNLIDGLMRGD